MEPLPQRRLLIIQEAWWPPHRPIKYPSITRTANWHFLDASVQLRHVELESSALYSKAEFVYIFFFFYVYGSQDHFLTPQLCVSQDCNGACDQLDCLWWQLDGLYVYQSQANKKHIWMSQVLPWMHPRGLSLIFAGTEAYILQIPDVYSNGCACTYSSTFLWP